MDKEISANGRQTARETVLELRHLTRRFGQRIAVNELDLQVYRGDVFGLLGPNGSGKTTTIRMIVNLVRPNAGEVLLFGQSLRQRHFSTSILGRVGSLIEQPTFYPFLSGQDNLLGIASFAGMPDTQVMRSRIDESLELVGLADRRRDRVQTYSLGMKQRLGIAAALLQRPDLVILDEPTNGLDPAGVFHIRQIIQHIARQGITIVVSSHLLYEVEQMCSRVAILEQGKLLVQDEVQNLLQKHRGMTVMFDDASVLEKAFRAMQVFITQQTWLQGCQVLHAVPGDKDPIAEYALSIDCPSEYASRLNRLLGEQGIYAAEIRRQKLTLEDFFLRLTAVQPDQKKESVGV